MPQLNSLRSPPLPRSPLFLLTTIIIGIMTLNPTSSFFLSSPQLSPSFFLSPSQIKTPLSHPSRSSTLSLSASSSPSSSRSKKPHQTHQLDHLGRTKRQARVGNLLKQTISTLLHQKPRSIRSNEHLEEGLLGRVTVLGVDVSPDLRAGRVTVSVRTEIVDGDLDLEDGEDEDEDSDIDSTTATKSVLVNDEDISASSLSRALSSNLRPISTIPESISSSSSSQPSQSQPLINAAKERALQKITKRKIHTWLITHSASIRHCLTQTLAHMKTMPLLTFHLVDVEGAVDVMALIERIEKEGFVRESIGVFGGEGNEMPENNELDDDDDGDEENGGGDDADFGRVSGSEGEGAVERVKKVKVVKRRDDHDYDDDGDDDSDGDGDDGDEEEQDTIRKAKTYKRKRSAPIDQDKEEEDGMKKSRFKQRRRVDS